MASHDPDLTLVYLPHLDDDLQRHGPAAPRAAAPAQLDHVIGPLLDSAEARGATVVALSEYGVAAVSHSPTSTGCREQRAWTPARPPSRGSSVPAACVQHGQPRVPLLRWLHPTGPRRGDRGQGDPVAPGPGDGLSGRSRQRAYCQTTGWRGAIWQRSRLVIGRLGVRVPSPAPGQSTCLLPSVNASVNDMAESSLTEGEASGDPRTPRRLASHRLHRY